MDGETQIIKCRDCGNEFESKIIVMMGRTLQGARMCSACFDKMEAARVEQEQKEKLCMRREEWGQICPPLYRSTNRDHASINKAALQNIDEWEDQRDGVGLAIRGESGRCKTRMAYLLLERLFMSGRSCASITAPRLAALCFECFDDSAGIKSEARSKMRSIRTVRYLLIDDLGKQKFTERAETELYDLIETRTSNLLPTFWTANVTSDAFAKMMSEDRATPIIRRLSEFSKVINL